MNTTTEQKLSKKELLAKGWTYLNDNFHKFTEDNRIKIALTLCVKDMPTVLEGDTAQRNETHIHYPAGWKPKEERIVEPKS